jgi:starch-binding outer membrane protein, SusD/RagB family
MKNRIKILLTFPFFMLIACNDLTLNPLSEGSSENWFSDETELNASLAALYNIRYWDAQFVQRWYNIGRFTAFWTDQYSDDWANRTNLNPITNGTLNGQYQIVENRWRFSYECIANANQIIVNIVNAKGNVTEEKLKVFEANARFIRAAQYAELIFFYGDVPYYEEVLLMDEAFELGRTDKNTILQHIYDDFDFAINNLPVSYPGSQFTFATKGAALAMKARTSLYMGDFEIARDAAKQCIDLNEYSLFPDFSTLFLPETRNTEETIFAQPRSAELGVILDSPTFSQPIPRTAGSSAFVYPSWDLFCSFLCIDGLPIDESPLYDPREPFKNRDPRCKATIVEFGINWLGFMYTPHPDSTEVLNFNTGMYQPNKDNKAVDQWASFTGLLWKKGLNEKYLGTKPDPDNVVIRYADVLLMYAEAKIELGEIDQSVLNAINQVRARAYSVDVSETSSYPAVTSTNQSELRKTVRIERRMEFAFEGLRYNDIIRWKLAEKVLNRPLYGLLDPEELKEKIVNPGLWFFPDTPPIDEDGVADFSSMHNAGTVKLLVNRQFDASRQYLWPIPTKEILINENLTQNPGY